MPQAPRISPALWEAQRRRITELKAQYIRKVNANWKLQKNYTKEKWQHASALVTKREAKGKITELSIDGKVISEKRRKKELRRYNVSPVEEEFVSNTTSGVVAYTPPSSNSKIVLIGNFPWLNFRESFNNLLCSRCPLSSPNRQDGTDKTTYDILQFSISSGFLIEMKHLLTMRGPTLEIFAVHLLFVALRVGGSKGMDFLRFLLESGVCADSLDPNDCRCSALYRAGRPRSKDPKHGRRHTWEPSTLRPSGIIAKTLIDSGANFNSGYVKPLLQAVRIRSPDLTRYILRMGADPRLLPAGGFSVMYFAIFHHDLILVDMLIKAGVNLNLLIEELQNTDLEFLGDSSKSLVSPVITPIQLAVFLDDAEIVNRLIEGGAMLDKYIEPEVLESMGQTLESWMLWTPLQISAEKCLEKITKSY
ncbi:hypothetical protein FocTR4_00002630 [Fusarium oxysporum f. sp. cubense]|uniref:Uncharacterized protein n=2 Tax=Fusarium oxysporum species complex TaxID=171631 RepID=A0A5C6TFL7_FUSOC|nr:hypothetical protein FocTR4_00002630 [Fusarium oxysporum f. sp. cubense]